MSVYLACLSTPTEIVRMAPVVHALRARDHSVQVLHNGSHDHAVHALYEFFDMSPDARLSPLQQAPRLTQLTAELMTRLDTHLQHIAPDALLVQGATSCALAATLAASYQDVPVAHLDAGWCTDGHALFPEDMNCGLIDRMAHWHFSTTPWASQHLLSDGVRQAQVHEAGNTAIDAAQWARQRMGQTCLRALVPPDVLRFLRLHDHGQLLLVAAQQREHWGRPMQRMAAAVSGLLQMHPQVTVVWPLPTSPELRADVQMGLACLPAQARQRLCLTEPLAYPALITLLEACRFALTDSDRLQQEASALQKPVLILRDSQEEQPLVAAGGALAVGHMAHQIIELANELLCDPLLLTAMQLPTSPFGDGLAAQRIADTLSAETAPRLRDNRVLA